MTFRRGFGFRRNRKQGGGDGSDPGFSDNFGLITEQSEDISTEDDEPLDLEFED
jgi:hypothetical protein